jgi:predicted dehydrogenase
MAAVRVGVVGAAGGMGRSHLKKLSTMGEVAITSLCDVNAQGLADTAKEFGGKTFTSAEEMLHAGGLDAVYVCLPPGGHGDIDRKVVRSGLHLFSEKPCTMYLREGLAVLKAVRRSGVITAVGYSVRYGAMAQQVRTMLEGRAVGMVVVARWAGLPSSKAWYLKMELGGGQFVEMITHQTDLLRYWLGEVNTVYAGYSHELHKTMAGVTIPDNQSMIMHFDRGTVGVVTGSLAMVEHYVMGTSIITKEGLIEVAGRELKVIPEKAIPIPDAPQLRAADVNTAFIQAVIQKDQSLVLSDYGDALKSAALSIAANESAEKGRPVHPWRG